MTGFVSESETQLTNVSYDRIGREQEAESE